MRGATLAATACVRYEPAIALKGRYRVVYSPEARPQLRRSEIGSTTVDLFFVQIAGVNGSRAESARLHKAFQEPLMR